MDTDPAEGRRPATDGGRPDGADGGTTGADGSNADAGGSDADAGGFEESYRSGAAPWDVGHPQPAVLDALDAGAVEGADRVLDVGCGTGEHALELAARGHAVVGVDASRTAVERARERARDRGLDGAVEFRVRDALELSAAGLGPVDAAVDVGLCHVFDDADRARYVAELGAVLRPGGRYLALVFSEHEPGDWGPRRVARGEFADAFEGWTVESVAERPFELTDGEVRGYLAVLRRPA